MIQLEEYRRSYEPRVQTTGPMVQDFKLYTEHLSPSERLLLKPQIDNVRLHLDRLAVRLHNVTMATEADWEEARDQAEMAWEDFQHAIDDAYAVMHAPRQEAIVHGTRDDLPPAHPIGVNTTMWGYTAYAPYTAQHATR